MISPLLANYKFHLQAPLNDAARAILATVPGFRYSTRKNTLEAPYSAGWLAARILDGWQAPYVMEAPKGVATLRPWGDEAAAELRARIHDSRIYSWLGDGVGGPWQLLPFQREAIWFALERNGAFLVEPAGAGKTVQGVCWAELDPVEGPVLIITKTGVVRQFSRAIEQFVRTRALELRPQAALPVRNGRRLEANQVIDEYIAERKEAGERPYVVAGWGSLRIHLPALLLGGWRSVIFDESHFARQHKRMKWTVDIDTDKPDYEYIDNASCAAWRIAQCVPRRLNMTATPIPDRRRGLWGQLTLVEPHAWGLTGTRFFKRYCNAQPGYGSSLDTTGTSNDQELIDRLSFALHRVPREVTHAQLPPVRTRTWYVPPERQDKTTGFKNEAKRLAKAANYGDQGAQAALSELHLMEAAARKRTAVLEVLGDYFDGREEGNGKVLLFTGRHRDCAELCDRIEKKWKHVEVFRGIKGEKGAYSLPGKEERVELQDAYMAHPGPCVLVGTGKAWGTGLDLQDTDLLGIVMLPWEPGDLVQWRGRINRLGQQRPCTVLLFVATGTIDEHVAYVLSDKTPDIERVIGDSELGEARASLRGLDDIDAVLDRIIEKAAAAQHADWETEEGWQAALDSAINTRAQDDVSDEALAGPTGEAR